MAQTERFAAIICLGCVIRGATSHYDYVCNQAASGIASVALQTGVPTMFGVLTTDTLEQAFDRAGAKAGNKGAEPTRWTRRWKWRICWGKSRGSVVMAPTERNHRLKPMIPFCWPTVLRTEVLALSSKSKSLVPPCGARSANGPRVIGFNL